MRNHRFRKSAFRPTADDQIKDLGAAPCDIWPQGENRRGVRNALVGFVQHYGRSYGAKKRPGQPFFDDGFEASAGIVQNMIREAIEDD